MEKGHTALVTELTVQWPYTISNKNAVEQAQGNFWGWGSVLLEGQWVAWVKTEVEESMMYSVKQKPEREE